MTSSIKNNTLVEVLSNEDYHSNPTYRSSSQLKDALVDVELFFKLHVSKELQKETTSAMEIGTYYHTAILEPEKLAQECAVWDGIRRGKAWLEFQETHKGKTILTITEVEKATNLINATKKDSEAMKLLDNGQAELSCFTIIDGVKVRVRADWIDMQKGFVMDLKSTTGSARDVQKTQKNIENYHYDLSAALYLDAFNQVLAKEKKPLLKDFYWVFASKDMQNCQVYKASERMIELGRIKYKRALKNILEASANGWEFPSTVISINPPTYFEESWKSENPVITETPKVKTCVSDYL
jgi:exodeoxyribonuclease VIII